MSRGDEEVRGRTYLRSSELYSKIAITKLDHKPRTTNKLRTGGCHFNLTDNRKELLESEHESIMDSDARHFAGSWRHFAGSEGGGCGSSLYSGIEFGRSRTSEGSSGGGRGGWCEEWARSG
jgi:hypothetical protein